MNDWKPATISRVSLQALLQTKRLVVAIEGNIGAGKSRVNQLLHSRGYTTCNEPVEAWTLLPLYYRNPSRYAFALQAQVLASYAGVGASDDCVIMERSAAASVGVFADMLLRDGALSPEQAHALQLLYMQLPIREPDVVVYLDVPLELCLQRVSSRARPEEVDVDLPYLSRVQAAYIRFLEGRRVLRVDCSGYEGRVEALADEIEARLALEIAT